MKKINTIILAIISLCNTSCSIKLNEEQKNADAVYLNIENEYIINNDNSTIHKYSHDLKLQSHASFNNLYGESFVVYNPDFQKLEIEAYTETPSGKKIYGKKNAYNKVLPKFAHKSLENTNLREMVVNHLATELGAVLNLDYTLSSNKDFLSGLNKNILLAKSSPIKELIYKFRIHKDKNLEITTLNIKPTEEKLYYEKNDKIYYFKFQNISSSNSGKYISKDKLPRIIINTGNSIENVCSVFNSQPFFNTNLNSKALIEINSGINRRRNSLDKILYLRNYVVDYIDLIKVPLKLINFEINNPNSTLEKASGSILDKTLLLNALLRHFGFEASIVAQFKNSQYDKYKDVNAIKNYYIKTKYDNTITYLSAIEKNERNCIDYLNQKNTIIDLNSGYINKIPNKTINEVGIYGKYKIYSKKYIAGSHNIKLINNANPYFKLFQNYSNYKKLFNLPTTKKEITSKVTQDSSIFEAYIADYKPFIQSGSFYKWKIPSYTANVKDQYKYPTNFYDCNYFINKVNQEYYFQVEIPQNMRVVTKNTSINLKNKIGNLVLKITETSRGFDVYKMISFNKNVESKEDYKLYLNLIRVWNNPNYHYVYTANL